jgi:Glycoside hydrolase 123 N-terminal domain
MSGRTFARLFFLTCLPAFGQWIGREAPAWEKEFQAWKAGVDKRVYPNSFSRDLTNRSIEIEACRNEFVSLQLGVRSPAAIHQFTARVSDLVTRDGRIDAKSIRVRYPSLIPVDENGQYTPDPLWVAPSITLESHQSQGIWISFLVPVGTQSGSYRGTAKLLGDGRIVAELQLLVHVLPATSTLPFRLPLLSQHPCRSFFSCTLQ